MKRLVKPHSFHLALFWRFFVSYFVLILVPVIVASAFTYVFVVRLIEGDAERQNNTIMRHFSEQTDATFSSLQTDMIRMLSGPNLGSFLRIAGEPPDNQQRNELVHSLMDQLGKFDTGDLTSSAYLYFAHSDLVVDINTHTTKDFYFEHYYPIDRVDRQDFFANFKGKKMMEFTEPHTLYRKPLFESNVPSADSNISVVMSYPFNSDNPDVYLVVNVSANKLSERIGIGESWVTGTAIVDGEGRVIGHAGAAEYDPAAMKEALRTHREGDLFVNGDRKALSFMKSGFDESWRYVSFIDWQALLQPARLIRMLSIGFLVGFLVMGSLVSYSLSRRMYAPIQEIKTGLASRRRTEGAARHRGDDFDLIKRFSDLIIVENEQLSRLVGGMYPIVHQHFIAKMLLGEYRDALSIDYYAKEIGFAYEPKAPRTVLCIDIQFYEQAEERLSETSKSFLTAELKQRIPGVSPSLVWVCETRADLVACVVQHDPILHVGPRETAEAVKLLLGQYGAYCKASIGVGRTVHAVEELHLSYAHANAMLAHKSMEAGVEICREEAGWAERVPWDGFLSAQEVNRIFNLYKSREYDKLLASVFDMLEAGRARSATARQVKAFCQDVLHAWIRAVESERSDFGIAYYSGLLDRLGRCVSWDDVRRCFEGIHAELFREEETTDRGAMFADIVRYIDEHYGEELSIEMFAERMNMSVGHFSRTFKEEVGEKYVEYIARLRMTKAKELLLETDWRIDDIAEKVGYWGRNSFIRIFRKYEGITPAKYRTIHQRT
ncbi:helix-turn-helix domain-containing protein [Paenibacillus flagellatus]|uniref:AraC family transcriptional regulator n=1 Tax=Paenibacillus flagellatus TaxID=2211139 RepID=A0A2V5K414_9BACL|nr:helix-turn-helix domain-containing protein [Paenibacillus flagellatus]PYI53981.1 AraC family transcriptional regulator [Paenibacillus flagellatus]